MVSGIKRQKRQITTTSYYYYNKCFHLAEETESVTTIKAADKKTWCRGKGNGVKHTTRRKRAGHRGEGEREGRRGKVSGAGPAFFPLISSTPLITVTEGGQEREKVSRETGKIWANGGRKDVENKRETEKKL